MKFSIRTRILTGVVLINLLGAIIVVVYMHQAGAGGLDIWAAESLKVSSASWNSIHDVGADELGDFSTPKGAAGYIESMKKISGADYGVLIDKSALDQKTFEAALEAEGKPSNWADRDSYVLVATTDEGLAEKMQLKAMPDAVPEIGKVVGIENGSCSAVCHRTIKGEGDFWKVSWSDDGNSRAHAVFPINDAKGKPVGIVYSIEDISTQAEDSKWNIYQTMIVIGITLLVSTLAIGGMLDSWVFKRLNRMIHSMEDLSVRVAGGDFEAKFVPDGSDDEIGQFEQFFAKFLDLMTSTLRALTGGK
jgi:methyl-accepting chemotaxis protein